MTNCLNPQDFEAFRDADLSPEQRQAFRSHIAGCDVCREELAAFRQMDAEIKASHQAITPRAEWLTNLESLLNAGSSRVDTKSSKQTRKLQPLVGLATAAILLITASLAAWNFRPTEKQASTPTFKSPPESTLPEAPQLASNVSTADKQTTMPRESAVLAQGDFLVGRHPKSDDEIELYWVLPIQRKQ
jgi:hypothetical protein